MALFSNRTMDEWIAEYAESHRHPMNRACHTVGIPTVAASVILLLVGIFVRPLLVPGVVLFVVGWVFQFVGHWYEGKRPEFLNDWRFLFVGLRWWFMKLAGKA